MITTTTATTTRNSCLLFKNYDFVPSLYLHILRVVVVFVVVVLQ